MFFNLYVLLFCTLIVHIRYSKKLKFSSNFKFSTMIEEFIKSEEKKKILPRFRVTKLSKFS